VGPHTDILIGMDHPSCGRLHLPTRPACEPVGGSTAAAGTLEGDEQLETLTRLNADDLLEALGLGSVRRGRLLLRGLCRPMARGLAERVVTYDRLVGRQGLPPGAAWALRHFVGRVEVAGDEQIPAEGPLLVVANHPGLSDTLALFSGLRRADLRVVAADWPFFRALPHTSRHLIYLPPHAAGRRDVVRQVVAHLREGGAVLAFPRGELEPDPAVLPGAVESLRRWSRSIGLFLRLVPEARIMPAVVSGVLSAEAQRHPITRLRRHPRDRKRLGEMLQILVPAYRRVTVRVAFGPAIRAEDLLARSADIGALTELVVAQAGSLIERPPRIWRVLVGCGGDGA
jgi:1-acyl-sn-glycerol-3-phosphate acyltransferase